MKRIIFVCSAGMSTSLLVNKTRRAIQDRELQMELVSMSEAEARRNLDDCAAILLGPQVSFLVDSLREAAHGTGIAVEAVNPINYGKMDGEAVLEQILRMLG